MASSTLRRKSRRAVRFTSCHSHTNLSLLSIFKIYLYVPRQLPASSKLHSPSSLIPALNFAIRLITYSSIYLSQMYPSSTPWCFPNFDYLFSVSIVPQVTMVLFWLSVTADRIWKAIRFRFTKARFGATLQSVPSFKPLLEQPSQYRKDDMKPPLTIFIYANEKDPIIFMHIKKLQTFTIEPAVIMISSCKESSLGSPKSK